MAEGGPADWQENGTYDDSNLENVDLEQERAVIDVSPMEGLPKHDNQTPDDEPQLAYTGAIEGTVLETRPRSQSKLQVFRQWSHTQIKCTRQMLNEKLGRSAKTVDMALDSRIEVLRDTQRKFGQLLYLTSQMIMNMEVVAMSQKSMAENFAFLSVKAPELALEFEYSSKIQKGISKHTEELVLQLKAFKQKMETLVHKTIEDTLETIKHYETTRLAYDASRNEVEKAQKAPPTTPTGQAKYEALVAEFEQEKARFEQLRHDVDMKIKLLNTNKVQVMHNQLMIFNRALLQYFSDNSTTIQPTIKELEGKLEEVSRNAAEWLEGLHSQDN